MKTDATERRLGYIKPAQIVRSITECCRVLTCVLSASRWPQEVGLQDSGRWTTLA